MKYKSGYVNILGLPNVGKSTLINAILNRNISITSHKSHTTRQKILGIKNIDNYQMIFCDTPGFIINPKYKIEKFMQKYIHQSIEEADIFIYLINIFKYKHDLFIKHISKYNKPIILIINKIDILNKEKINKIYLHVKKIKNIKIILQISALKKININELLEIVKKFLPEHPPYYERTYLTNKSEHFFITEIIRKNIFFFYHKEIPYETHVNLIHIKKNQTYNIIIFQLLLTRKSQRNIIKGKYNSMINKLIKKCQYDLKYFYKKHIKIELLFKINKKWNNDYKILKNIGYN